MIGHVEGIHLSLEEVYVMNHLFQVCPLGGPDLTSDHEFSRLEDFSETKTHLTRSFLL